MVNTSTASRERLVVDEVRQGCVRLAVAGSGFVSSCFSLGCCGGCEWTPGPQAAFYNHPHCADQVLLRAPIHTFFHLLRVDGNVRRTVIGGAAGKLLIITKPVGQWGDRTPLTSGAGTNQERSCDEGSTSFRECGLVEESDVMVLKPGRH